MTHRIVVLGAGYAGLGAAKRVARRMRGGDARVTLVNATGTFVERVRLHQLATGQVLPDHPLTDLLAGTGVELVVARVTGLDTRARTVRLDTAPHTLRYDTLVYALGSRADVDSVPGAGDHAFTVAEADRALRLRACLAGMSRGTVLVVGGGLTGIETTTELAETHPHLRTGLVADGSVGGWLSRPAQRHLHRAMRRMRVQVHRDAHVTEVGDGKLAVHDGRHLEADAVVWAAGFRVPGLAGEAGLAVDERGRMVVDATLRSVSHPEVYGVGDAAAAPTPDGSDTRMSCQTGLPMGLKVADIITDALGGRRPRTSRTRYVGQNISLGRHDGVTQFTRADDSPIRAVLTGRASARLKEAVTRGTVAVMRNPGPYRPTPRVTVHTAPGST